ncbi:MAG: hypothetical protein HQL43_14480 [Alphaproteobacteria bacterium]|nr:hypothetical protein [Alphaproteobacteria bacterium]
MMKCFVRLFAAFGLILVFLPQPAAGEGPYRRLPWHLVDVYWTLDPSVEEQTFQEITMDVTIEGDPLASPPLFISPISVLRLGEARTYAGLQTWVKHDPEGHRGPGLIFSRFGERRLDRLRVAPGGTFESAGYEGDFISVRHGMPWGAGQYVAKLQSEPKPTAPDGERWLTFQVCLKLEASCGKAGDLAFPNPNVAMQRKFYSFVEIYDKLTDESQITPVTVTFGPPRVNGKPVNVVKALAIYPANVPFRARSFRTSDGGVKVIIGERRSPLELPEQGGYRREQVLP